MDELVKNLKDIGVLKTPDIIKAFLEVDRKDFVPENMKNLAYADEALPIGHGQTISQPYTVAFMLELLLGGDPSTSLRAGKIMDVGYGSGWTTALLAHIAGNKGKIYSFERVKELCNFGEENLKKYPELCKRVSFFCKDASRGVPEDPSAGGLDGIIAAAALSAANTHAERGAELEEVPEAWREQLKIGGRLVYPKDNAVFREIKISEDEFESEKYPGFVFVPFIKG